MRAVSEQPLSHAIADDMRGKILNGEEGWRPGDALPAEKVLTTRYEVSKDTVRRAIDRLVREGLIAPGNRRQPRRVRESHVHEFPALTSESVGLRIAAGYDGWVTDTGEQGGNGGMKITTVELVEAPPEIAAGLRVAPGTVIVARRRVRSLNGEPHNISDSYYPLELVQGTPVMSPADIPQGVIAVLAGLGNVQAVYDDTWTARMPVPEETALLGIPAGVPVMIQTRTGYTADRKTVIRVTVTTWPADRSRISYKGIPA